MKVLAGTSNSKLCKDIARQLKLKLVNSNIKRFADGEVYVEINENIRGNSIFVVQSTSNPANDNLMELLICIDALRRSSAKNITAVIPYFGYARQDRKVVPRTSISAKLVSNLITKAGADRVVTVDLHAGQIQGFFDIPVDNLFATPIFARHAKKKIKNKNIICVAPDVGGTERARALGKLLNVGLAIVDKRRPKPGQSQVMNVIGDVKGKTCVIVDDIIDSGGTIVNAAKALKDRGAKEVYVYIRNKGENKALYLFEDYKIIKTQMSSKSEFNESGDVSGVNKGIYITKLPGTISKKGLTDNIKAEVVLVIIERDIKGIGIASTFSNVVMVSDSSKFKNNNK